MAPPSGLLKFTDGSIQFRLRLAVSLLSHRPILITNIRSDSLTSPGLNTAEASFLHLLDKLTNGSQIEINTTGTQVKFTPGIILGGECKHQCEERSIGWFLEGILPLAPFGKEPLELQLEGITDGLQDMDPSVDYFLNILPTLLPRFGIVDEDRSQTQFLRIHTRGGDEGGGGRIAFSCPIVKELKPLDFTDPGLIKRIRGYAVSCRMNPTSAARVSHASKGVFLRLLPDVWIHTDVHSASSKKNRGGCGPDPSLSLCVFAESNTGVVLGAESAMKKEKRELAEDLGERAASMLLEEVRRGGCVDTSIQTLVLLFMLLGPEDVSRVRVGTLSQYTIHALRLFKQVFQVEFKVRADEQTQTVLMSCLGIGYRNMAKAST